jgi:hypothetical protein
MPSVTRSVALTTVLCLAVTLGAARAARADTININSGALDFGYSSGVLTVSGDRGFWMQVGMGITGGIYGPWEKCSDPVCGSGATIPLFAYWSGNDLPGVATFEGKTYPKLGSADVSQSAWVKFFGTAIAPSLDVGSTATVTAPFTFQGLFIQPVDEGPYSLTVNHDLVGAGTATLWLEKGYEGTSWRVMASRYEFAPLPTPEPATLVLVGSGLALAFARRRVRSSRR